MPPPSTEPCVVLGFCPDFFRAEMPYLFVPAVAQLNNGSWYRLGNPSVSFPPNGTIFVPPELYPEPFRHRDLAAWEVLDQPHYTDSKLGARFRAIRLSELPLEVLPIPVLTTSPELRRVLTEEGVPHVARRADRSALLEFQDGRIVLARLNEHPSNPHRSVVAPGTLTYPLPAWPSTQPLSTQLLSLDNQARRVATLHEAPRAPEVLDLATLEEALTCARRGGLGAVNTAPPAKVRRAIEQLEEVVRSFEGDAWAARRQRLGFFLREARDATESREQWEAFLADQPVFRSALEAGIASEREALSASIRAEVAAQEPELHERIDRLKQEMHELEEWAALVREDVKKEESRLGELVKGIAIHNAVAVAEAGQYPPEGASNGDMAEANGASLKAPVVPDDAVGRRDAAGPTVDLRLTIPRPATSLSTPAEAAQHLERNLIALGVLKLSARLLAREALVAASLGQLILLRGSFAEAVAEAFAVSMTGGAPARLVVSVGTTQPLAWPEAISAGTDCVLIEGINRSCLATCGEPLKRQLEDRVLARQVERLPLLIGTLLDGPSTLPLGPEMSAYGPVFDTDCLSWDFYRNAADMEPGRCEETAWELEDSRESDAPWADAIDEIFPRTCIAWERAARAAIRRLVPLLGKERSMQAQASFAFGWLVPRYLSYGADQVGRPLRFPDEFPRQELASADQRLMRLLRSAGMEGEGDATGRS